MQTIDCWLLQPEIPEEIKEDQTGVQQLSGCGNIHPHWGNYLSWGTNVRSDVIRGEPNHESWFQDSVRKQLINGWGAYDKQLDYFEDFHNYAMLYPPAITCHRVFLGHQHSRLLPLSWSKMNVEDRNHSAAQANYRRCSSSREYIWSLEPSGQCSRTSWTLF